MNQIPKQQGRPDGAPSEPGTHGAVERDALAQAMHALMDRVREDVLAQERLLEQDPQAGERAARLRILLNETRRRLENIERAGRADPSASPAAP